MDNEAIQMKCNVVFVYLNSFKKLNFPYIIKSSSCIIIILVILFNKTLKYCLNPNFSNKNKAIMTSDVEVNLRK